MMNFFEHGATAGKALIQVLKNERPWRRPIWLMRQAGRYLPEYRALRADAGSFLDLCYSPDFAAEVTLQPLRRFDLDAAILFADILLIPQALGSDLAFVENEGPKLSVVRSDRDFSRLSAEGAVERLAPVYDTVRRVKANLPPHVGFIGFCGAPWTVATYMVEGGTSPDRGTARLAAHGEEPWFSGLIDLLTESSIEYLCAQIDAGVDVVQIFDTWAGDLSDGLRQRYCFDPIRRIAEAVKQRHPGVPIIGFAKGIGAAHVDFAKSCALDAVGLEWSVPLHWVRDMLQPEIVVQGNLDPLSLVHGGTALTEGVRHVVGTLRPERHIMNLGHGVRLDTDPEHVSLLVDTVRDADRDWSS